MTPDPYTNSGRLNDPQSWNRYAYTRGDPVNRLDRNGTDDTPTFSVTGWDFGSLDDYWDYSSSINPGTYMSCMSDPVCYGAHEGQTVGGSSVPYGTVGFTQAQVLINAAELALAGKKSFSANCQSGLAKLGVNPQALAGAAPGVSVVDGTASTMNIGAAYGNATLGNAAQAQYNTQYSWFLQNYGLTNLTIGEMFNVTPGVTAWTPTGGNAIYINSYWMSPAYTNVNQDMALVMHEMLHEMYGLDDGDIQTALGLSSGPSENITQWMLNNCINQ